MAESTVSNRWSRHVEFYVHTVTFLVEDHLFRIPREPLETESTVFRDTFLLPQGDSETAEGQSDTCPVTLPGISKKEFEGFVRALMHRQHGKNKGLSLSQAQWTSVLKLSTTWKFDELRNVAIQHLDPPSRPLNPVDKFALASTYGIKKWLLPALLVLAQRPEPIKIEEGRRMGFENALKLAALREQLEETKVIDRICEKYILKTRDEKPKASKYESPKSRDERSAEKLKERDKECIELLTQLFGL
ncbi:hypothetical protein EDC04DRAFT_1459952 [Pisolithus marmoratus]|nr:hypothetical protein EDC04DRAFT_1459952 [Pisolithus marmoratus]